MNLYLELFGYLGTALVILSMMMSSVVRLRIINISGGIISLIYAILTNTMPVVVLNATLITINTIQVIRFYRCRTPFSAMPVRTGDAALSRLISVAERDLARYFPNAREDIERASDAYIVFNATAAVGVFVGEREGDTVQVLVDYVLPAYRDLSVARYLFPRLRETGVRRLVASACTLPEHEKYLKKMGFVPCGDTRVLTL